MPSAQRREAGACYLDQDQEALQFSWNQCKEVLKGVPQMVTTVNPPAWTSIETRHHKILSSA